MQSRTPTVRDSTQQSSGEIEVALLCVSCLQFILPIALPELAKVQGKDTDLVCAACAVLFIDKASWRVDEEQVLWLEQDVDRLEESKLPCRVPSKVGTLKQLERPIALYLKDAYDWAKSVNYFMEFQGTAYGALMIERCQENFAELNDTQ